MIVILKRLVKKHSNNIKDLVPYFIKYQQIYQYVYIMLFAKFFMQNQKRGVDWHFKDWLDKKRKSGGRRKEEDINKFKQKPIDPNAQPKQWQQVLEDQKYTPTIVGGERKKM